MSNNYRKMIEAIFYETCKFSNEYGSPDDAKFFDEWQDCNACILRRTQWPIPHKLGIIIRDLCFVIWHEGLLVKRRRNE